MSYHIVDQIIQTAFIDPTDKLVLIALASHADDTKREAWPSIETLQHETGFGRRTVQRSLRNLEHLGVIRDTEPSREKKGGSYKSTRYIVADVRRKEIADLLFNEWKRKQRQRDALIAEQRQSGAVKQRRSVLATASLSHGTASLAT